MKTPLRRRRLGLPTNPSTQVMFNNNNKVKAKDEKLLFTKGNLTQQFIRCYFK